eukprot:473103-Rhodomonas_salina.2
MYLIWRRSCVHSLISGRTLRPRASDSWARYGFCTLNNLQRDLAHKVTALTAAFRREHRFDLLVAAPPRSVLGTIAGRLYQERGFLSWNSGVFVWIDEGLGREKAYLEPANALFVALSCKHSTPVRNQTPRNQLQKKRPVFLGRTVLCGIKDKNAHCWHEVYGNRREETLIWRELGEIKGKTARY